MGSCVLTSCRNQTNLPQIEIDTHLRGLPPALLSCARFIYNLHHDSDFLLGMWRLKRHQLVDNVITYRFPEGFHMYDMQLYGPILSRWVRSKWNNRLVIDESQQLLHFGLVSLTK